MNEQTSTFVPAALAWHARTVHDIVTELRSDPVRGLSSSEVAERLAKHGPNALHEEKKEPWWHEALEALTEPLQLLLIAVACVVSYLFSGHTGIYKAQRVGHPKHWHLPEGLWLGDVAAFRSKQRAARAESPTTTIAPESKQGF